MRNLTNSVIAEFTEDSAVQMVSLATGELHGKAPISLFGSVEQYPTFGDFPAAGKENVLYVDQSQDPYQGYVWFNGAYEQLGGQNLDVVVAPISYVPTATGNTANLNEVVVDPNGDIWVIDYQGDAALLELAKHLDVLLAVQPTPALTGNTTNLMTVFKDANGVTWIVDRQGEAIACGAPETITYQENSTTFPAVAMAGDEMFVTDDGTATGKVLEQWIFDGTNWVQRPRAKELWTNETGTLTNVDQTQPWTAKTDNPDGSSASFSTDGTAGVATVYGSDKVVLNSGGEYEFVNVPEDTDASSTKVLVYNPTTYKVEYASFEDIAVGAPVTVGTDGPPIDPSIEGAIHLVTDDGTPTGTVLEQYIYDTDSGVWIEMQRNAQDTLKFGTASPTANGEWDGEEFFVTSDGTHAGEVLEQWLWDKQSATWIKRPTPSTTPETTSLTPVVWNGAAYVPAQADAETKVADLLKLADGTYLHDGKVIWEAHGLTVGSWYYLSQTAAGGIVTPAPNNGFAQQLFFVESADVIHVDIEEAYQAGAITSTASPSFTNTVYVNTASPTTATIFDTANPPATNNNALKANVNNLYIGTDGSTWTYNSATSTYGAYAYPASVPAGVFAQLPANFAVANMSGIPVTGYTTVNNTAGSAWNPANGLFTAPRSGWYDINGSLLFASSNWNAGAQASIGIQLVPGAIIASGQSATLAAAVSNAQISTAHVQTKIYLNAGQGVRLLAYQNSGSAKATGSPINNIISITEVR